MKTKLVSAIGVVAALSATLLGVWQEPAGAGTFSPQNHQPITFLNDGPSEAFAAPARIKLFGATSLVTDVNVQLVGVTHTFPDDLDIELVGPDGTAVPLMSDNCGGKDIVNVDLSFDDLAASSLPDDPAESCASGSFRPSNEDVTGEIWSVDPTASTLAAFNGSNPNGEWQLYVRDDADNDSGQIAHGWSLSITTGTDGVLAVPGGGTSGIGTASRYPLELPVAGRTGTITDVDVTLPGLYHSFPADLDVLVVAPNGASVLLMANACNDFDLFDVTLTFDDDVTDSLSEDLACGSGRVRPSSFSSGSRNLPSPAPARPYAGQLAVFDGADPNGTWRLFVNDEGSGDGGFLTGRPELTITTSDGVAPDTGFAKKPHSSTRRTAKLAFIATEAGSRFECLVDSSRFDGGQFKPCGSTLRLKHLRVGKHRVEVRAVDTAGNVDATPAVVRWKVRHP